MSDLALVTPVTDAELPAYREVLETVLTNLARAEVAADLVVVVQTRGGPADPVLDFLRRPGIDLVVTDRYSASRARNVGIGRIRRGEHRRICFLDADAVPGVGLLRSVRSRLADDEDVLVGRVRWHEGTPPADADAAAPGVRVPIERCLFGTYLWSAFLPAAAVLDTGVRFDESIGPGEDTRLKSGEDVLFLAELAEAAGLRHAVRFDACALHPARPSDYSKHLFYAEGQGALFVRLLRKRLRRPLKASVLASFGLSLGNALLRVVALRPRSLPILGLRLRGAWRALRAT